MPAPSPRRRFLQQTAALGAGVWIASESARAQSRSPNEKLNVACIGCGGKGASHVEAAAAHENLVALCDVDERRAGRMFEKHSKARRFQDFRKMLDEIGGELDAVFVSTPDHTHAPAAVMAMRLGKHVYCEKPLARSVHECRVMAEVAREMKVATQMGNQGHSGRGYRQMVEMVRSGVIGAVREAHAWTPKNFSADARPQDRPPAPPTLQWDLWVGPAPKRPYHPAYLPFNWRGWWDFGTGGLGDMACHIIDPIYWALDLDLPAAIEADGEPKSNPEGFAKHLTVKYEFAARGEEPPVTLFWHHGDHVPQKRSIAGVQLPSDVTLPGQGTMMIGDKGIMIGAHASGLVALLPRDRFADYKPPQVEVPGSHQEEFFLACKTGSPTGSNFDYAARLSETVLLGNVAHRLGKPLAWDAKTMSAKGCPEADEVLRREYRKGWTL